MMAACVAVCYITSGGEDLKPVHVTFGLILAGALIFRVLWGALGSRHARFASFLRGWRALWDYFLGVARLRPRHSAGHTPAGGWMIVALLVLGFLVCLSGVVAFKVWGGSKGVHEFFANALLAVVGFHVVGALAESLLYRENLVRAMVDGFKQGRPDEAIRRGWSFGLAILLLCIAITVGGGWIL